MRINPKYKRALGDAIYRKRKNEKLTQEELSELTNLSRRWIQKVESGQSNPNWRDMLQIMVVLGLETKELAEEVGIHVPVSTN